MQIQIDRGNDHQLLVGILPSHCNRKTLDDDLDVQFGLGFCLIGLGRQA